MISFQTSLKQRSTHTLAPAATELFSFSYNQFIYMLSFYFVSLAKHVLGFQMEEHCPITKGLHSIIGKGNILQIYLVLTITTD